jgi:hypothetical protein
MVGGGSFGLFPLTQNNSPFSHHADCAQLHRHIGRHVSQTKGISTNTYMWYEDEVRLMESVGNARANAVYMARGAGGRLKPSETDSQ